MNYRPEELLISVIARLLDGMGHIAVGASSPIPGSAALLARERSGGATRVTMLGSLLENDFTDGGRELFDCAAQGRIDAFFLGGGQIDGEANVNLVGKGEYPRSTVRFPGSFGSPFMYFMVPNVILFVKEHSPRVLVEKVDFISAPGTSPSNLWRRGGPVALITGMAAFSFQAARRRFRLESVHPGHDVDDVVAATGFDFDCPERVPPTPGPTPETLALMRGPLAARIAETYPKFAGRVFSQPMAEA